MGGFLGRRVHPVYSYSNSSPQALLSSLLHGLQDTQMCSINHPGIGSPRTVLSRRLSAKGAQTPPQSKRGEGEGRGREGERLFQRSQEQDIEMHGSIMLCLSKGAWAVQKVKATFCPPTNRLATVAALLGIRWSNQTQGERQAMFLFIISQHIHLRPHRKRFHAKYTNLKMPRRQERGKKGWFTAEKPTSKMLPGFPLGNNCCICK